MEEIIQLLHKEGYSCVIANKEIRTFSQHGVKDLYDLLENDADFLKDALVADKVIGKAAAAILILGGIKEIYADVISLPALELLRTTKIKVSFGQEVPHIINRDRTGWCPLEKICYQEESVETIFPLIEGFIQKMQRNSPAT